jgi:hypothetical protein
MNGNKDIGARLESWARWCFSGRKEGADSMTGVICERMSRAALGDVWSGHEVREDTDDQDAVAIERGMRLLSTFNRLLLHWCYIEQARPEVVCRKLSIPLRPASEFVDRFREAQEAIEDIVDGGNR